MASIDDITVESIRGQMPGYSNKKTLDRAKRAFKALDSDGSGNVEVGELGSQLAAMGYELSPEQVNAFIADIDRDSDGQVSAMEFLTALHDRMRAAAVSGCFKDAKAWKFDNPRKFSFLTKTLTIVIGMVQVILAIIPVAEFEGAAGSVDLLTATWKAPGMDGLAFINATNGDCATAEPAGGQGGATLREWRRNAYFAGIPPSCNCSARVCPSSWYTSTNERCTISQSTTGCKQTSTTTKEPAGCVDTLSAKDKEQGKVKCTRTTTYDCDCTHRRCSTATTAGSCNNDESQQGCANIPGVPAKQLTIWRGKKLCVSYGTPGALEREQHAGKDDEGRTLTAVSSCSPGWRKPGCFWPDSFRSNSTIMCFPEAKPCPLTGVTRTASTYTRTRNVAIGLPIIALQAGVRVGTGAWNAAYGGDDAYLAPGPTLGFDSEFYSTVDTISEAELYTENGVDPKYASASRVYALGYRRELGWSADCPANRQQLDGALPLVDELGRLLSGLLAVIIIDFLWSAVEAFTIADSMEFKWLALRTCADIIAFAVTVPMVLAAAGAGRHISSIVDGITGCTSDPKFVTAFGVISERATKMAGTNTVILVLKGFKVLFMSALVQHGVYVAQVLLCGKKKARKDIEMAFQTKAAPAKGEGGAPGEFTAV